ncbi:MAG: Uma2 family endonuclease [Hyphomicrobiaceae bacterium]|nr:Uma2 family endonuclease [Hyphomicrobiaceae bacterium]
MADTASKPATYEDLQDVPPNMVAQIIGGQLITQPRPAPKHARASSVLGGKLGDPFDYGDSGPGGWIILDEPELHLGEHILVPDLAGWRRENMPELPQTAWFETPPDWICEVISPSTARYDRLEKRNIYGQFKVSHLWFIDPDAKTLEAFELQKSKWVLIATNANKDDIAVAPFAEVPFSLGVLWS